MRNHSIRNILVLTLAASLGACSSVREAMEGHEDAVAVAAGYQLTVDHLAELLAAVPESIAPATPRVIDRTVDLWVSYAVLASEYAREDDLAGLDIEPLTRFNTQQALAWMLRDDILREHGPLSDSALRALYEEERPYARVRPRHILIRVRSNHSEAQVDSLRQLAEDVRERILAGEVFAELARSISEDPSSAPLGGNLGWKRRGQLLPELDSVIFQIEPGTISDVVRTDLGFHIVEVAQRAEPEFDRAREAYEKDLNARRQKQIEDAYIDSVVAAADMEITPGSIELLRLMAFSPRLPRLGSAERQATLVNYRGGEITLGEWADFIIRSGPNAQNAFNSPDTAAVARLLRLFARNEIIARAARVRGHQLTDQQIDSVTNLAYQELQAAAYAAGYLPATFNDSAPEIPAAVDQAFGLLFLGRRNPRALDRASPALWRDGPAILVHTYRYPQVIARLKELRARLGQEGAERPEEARP